MRPIALLLAGLVVLAAGCCHHRPPACPPSPCPPYGPYGHVDDVPTSPWNGQPAPAWPGDGCLMA